MASALANGEGPEQNEQVDHEQPQKPQKKPPGPGRKHHAGEEDDRPVWRRRCPGKAMDRFGCGCVAGCWLLILSAVMLGVAYSRVVVYEECRAEECEKRHCWESVVFPNTAPCMGAASLCFDNCHSPVAIALDEQAECLKQRCDAQCPGGAVGDMGCYDACNTECAERAHMEFALTRKASCLERAMCKPLEVEEKAALEECKASDDVPPRVCSDPATRLTIMIFVWLIPMLGMFLYGTFEEVFTNFKICCASEGGKCCKIRGESRRRLAGHITWGIGLAFAIGSASILWAYGNNLGKPLLLPVAIFFVIFLNCCSCTFLSVSRLYFGAPPQALEHVSQRVSKRMSFQGKKKANAAAAADDVEGGRDSAEIEVHADDDTRHTKL